MDEKKIESKLDELNLKSNLLEDDIFIEWVEQSITNFDTNEKERSFIIPIYLSNEYVSNYTKISKI